MSKDFRGAKDRYAYAYVSARIHVAIHPSVVESQRTIMKVEYMPISPIRAKNRLP